MAAAGDNKVAKLAAWWEKTAEDDFGATIPKMEQYGGGEEGSDDLLIMGYALSRLHIPEGTPAAVNQEAACWLYSLGKIARLVTDYNRGEPGKPDHWHDLTVYSMMARRLQSTGVWP